MAKRLTAAGVRAAKPGKHYDLHGLFLLVTPTGARCWVWRGTVRGKRRDYGLGAFPYRTLAEARDLAYEYRKMARDGGDPRTLRTGATVPTFAAAAERVIQLHRPTWKSSRTEAQWRASLAAHALPVLGSLTVDAITTSDVFRVLSTIWTDRPAIAGHLRTRIGAVMKWTIAEGYRIDNPAGDALAAALPRQNGGTRHHRAAAHGDVAEVLRVVRESGAWAGAKLAVAFTALTATRGAEARGARWSELDGDTWNIPGERTKTGARHRVPLSTQALAILDEARELARGGIESGGVVFPPRPHGAARSPARCSGGCWPTRRRPFTDSGRRFGRGPRTPALIASWPKLRWRTSRGPWNAPTSDRICTNGGAT